RVTVDTGLGPVSAPARSSEDKYDGFHTPPGYRRAWLHAVPATLRRRHGRHLDRHLPDGLPDPARRAGDLRGFPGCPHRRVHATELPGFLQYDAVSRKLRELVLCVGHVRGR